MLVDRRVAHAEGPRHVYDGGLGRAPPDDVLRHSKDSIAGERGVERHVRLSWRYQGLAAAMPSNSDRSSAGRASSAAAKFSRR